MHSVEKTVYAQLSTLAWAACGSMHKTVDTVHVLHFVTRISIKLDCSRCSQS